MTKQGNDQTETPRPGKTGDINASDHEVDHAHVASEQSSRDSSATSDQEGQAHQVVKTANKSLTPSQKKAMVGMTLVSFLQGSVIAVMIPFFPAEAASRGISQMTISAVFSIFAMTRVILSPIVGRVAPAIGVTKLFNIGIATAGITTIVFGALNHIGDTQLFVAACFLVRMAEAAGIAAVMGCKLTIIANQFQEHASSIVALTSASRLAGFSIAPAIGSGLYAVAGFSFPFYVIGIAVVVVAALSSWLMPSVDRYQRTPVPYLSMLRNISKSLQLWLRLLNLFQCSFVLMAFHASVAPYADEALGISPSGFGLYITVATAAHTLTGFLWAQVAQRARHPHAIIGVGMLVASVSMLLIPPSPLLDLTPRWWLFGLGMTLMEIFIGGALIPCFQLILASGLRQGLPNDLVTQAFVSGVFNTVFCMGCVVGPPLGGFIVDAYGFPVMMTGLAGFALLVSLLNMAYHVFAIRPCKADKSPSVSDEETPVGELQHDSTSSP